MTLTELRARNLIIFECIAGSQSYNLHTPQSDLDIRGVFVLPETEYFGLNYVEQVHDAKNDIVFYELRRFVELSYNNNPNILEMLAMPERCILYKHPAFDLLKAADFVSKRCKDTFAGYARSQISKAHGLNKKIMSPMEKERKTLLDFCYIVQGNGSVAAAEWLTAQGFEQRNCGLVHIPHTKNVYALFYDANGTEGYEGIIKKSFSNEVSTSSTRKEVPPITTLFCNEEAYSVYCKKHKEYWEWVEKRSEVRYENTVAHGKNYDAKNMMHTFRLLDMALEIVRDGKIIVERTNRDYLLQIKKGEFMYDDLVAIAEEKMVAIETAFANCTLPTKPNFEAIQASLVSIRKTIYVEWDLAARI